MTAIVILNIVLSAFVIIGVLSLLAWGILADRKDRTARATVRASRSRSRSRSRRRARVSPRGPRGRRAAASAAPFAATPEDPCRAAGTGSPPSVQCNAPEVSCGALH